MHEAKLLVGRWNIQVNPQWSTMFARAGMDRVTTNYINLYLNAQYILDTKSSNLLNSYYSRVSFKVFMSVIYFHKGQLDS